MENIITNNAFTSNEGINNETADYTPVSKKESYNQMSTWEKVKYRFNQFLNAIYIVRCICCFTSICSVIGTLVLIFGGSMSLAGFMYLIGIPSALLACPLKFIQITLSLIVGGFSIGLCFLGFGCVIGAAIGFILSVALWIYFPAFVTIPHFFKELC